MRTLTEQLANYAAYHRDRRNIATHFVGIPMIVFAVCVLLARPAFALPGTSLTVHPAWIVGAAAALFYLRLSFGYGLAMSALLFVALIGASRVAEAGAAVWLATGVGLFVLGWIVQFVGHYYEGRKPAFVDDLIGLLIGPLFVVAEIAFALGFSRELKRAIEAQVGPTRIRRRGAQAA
jgi:uncharacterized membrane protein YGL010W